MIRLTIEGQIPSGKNAIIITRTGLRFPAKRFVVWRKQAIEQLTPQLQGLTLPITVSCNVTVTYTSEDMRRRDVPGMIDALWHVLEKIEIVADDKQLGGHGSTMTFINKGKVKGSGGVLIEIEPII